MKEEHNTGRQIEFDYMKGIFMLFIFLIHAFQATGSQMGPAVSGIYVFATMSGAAIYIFVAGFGTVYDSAAVPSQLVKRGVRLVLLQYLTNLLYVLSLLIPYPFVKNGLGADGADMFSMYISIYAQFINIFFITGIIYLVLAFLKKVHCPLPCYLILAALIAIAAPVIYGADIDIPVIGYVSALLIGEAPFVSFTPLYFLPYALTGVAAARFYRRIKDKGLFYKRVIPASVMIIIVWWVSVFVRLSYWSEGSDNAADIFSFTQIMDYAYSCPDLWHVAASLAHIALFAAVIFFCEEKRKKKNASGKDRGMISSQFLYYSRNITRYYALHLTVYLIALGFHGYLGFSSGFCLILALVSMIVTGFLVRMSEKIW